MTVLCVVGPTASGKTKMAVALARRLNGEVVSVDSMQIYRGMTIGTAAPTAEEMEGVPHHMIAVADPAEQWSAARFCQAADACIQDILSRGKLPGAGRGHGPVPGRPDPGRRLRPRLPGGPDPPAASAGAAGAGALGDAAAAGGRGPGDGGAGCTCGTKSAFSGP